MQTMCMAAVQGGIVSLGSSSALASAIAQDPLALTFDE